MRWVCRSMPESSERPSHGWVVVALCVWLAVVGAGMGLLAGYVNNAGSSAASPPERLASTSASSPRPFRLMMFAHPQCPCTAASLGELARVMSRCKNQIEATVYFYRPDTRSSDWVTGNLWNTAVAIPGVHAEIDPSGATAAQFGSTTSGDVLLYDATGRLRFHGGITQGRGHEGDNPGKSTVISIAKGEETHVDHGPVFGCAIRSASAPCRE